MGKKLSLFRNVVNKKVKLAEFALNNICVAKCNFCSIWKQKQKYSVELDKSLAAIQHLSHLGLSFITLTGGEPLLHPHFAEIIQCCTDNNIVSSILVADGRLLTEKRLNALQSADIDMVCVSIDHHMDEVVSRARGIENLMPHLEKAVVELKARNICAAASILISTYNHTSLAALFEKCSEMGFDLISINYPEFSESPVYTLGGSAVDLTKDQIITALEEVKRLKKTHYIVNPVASLDNIITYLRGETPEFLCLGGHKTFFIDWHFNVYPCMHHGRALGDILELKESDFVKNPCNECNMSWYRDISIFFHGTKSILPFLSTLPLAFKVSSF